MGSLIIQRSYHKASPNVNSAVFTESGQWLNGLADGVNWCDMQSSGGLIFGSQDGNQASTTYNDSVAMLAGLWAPNQTVTATVKTINQQGGGSCYEELELWLRGTITSSVITGYECNFRCANDGSQYTEIVKWNGARGDFTSLSHKDNTNGFSTGLQNGDTISAAIDSTGGIVVKLNGVTVNTVTDTTYRTGNPGMGHWLRRNGNSSANLTDYGFTAYSVVATT